MWTTKWILMTVVIGLGVLHYFATKSASSAISVLPSRQSVVAKHHGNTEVMTDAESTRPEELRLDAASTTRPEELRLDPSQALYVVWQISLTLSNQHPCM